jgi:hypothetical protein
MPFLELRLPVAERDEELIGVEPVDAGVRRELSDVAAEVVGEDDPAQDVALDEDEGGKPSVRASAPS